MNRRKFILSSGAVGTTVFAGCTGGGSEGEDTPDVEAGINDAESAIEEARDLLKEEGEKFEVNDGTVSIEEGTIRDKLSVAESHLDSVQPYASEEQSAYITYLYDFIDYLDVGLTGMSHMAEAINSIQSAMSYKISNRYDDAIEALENGESEIDEAESKLSELDNLERDIEEQESEFDNREPYDVGSKWISIGETLSATREYLRGLRYWYRAEKNLNKAFDEGDKGNYSTAISAASDASAQYSTAETTFRDAEDDVPSDMRPDFISSACQTGHYRDGSTALKEGLEAEQNNNSQRARDKYKEAEEAFGAAENC